MYCTSKMSFKSPQVVITDAAAKAFSLQVEMSQTNFLEYILYHSHIISSFSLDILCLEPVFLNIEASNCLCVVLHGDIYLKRIYEDLDRKKWPIILQYRF